MPTSNFSPNLKPELGLTAEISCSKHGGPKQCQMVGVRHTLVCLGNPIMRHQAGNLLTRNRFLRNYAATVPHMKNLIIFHSLKYFSTFVEKKLIIKKYFHGCYGSSNAPDPPHITIVTVSCCARNIKTPLFIRN